MKILSVSDILIPFIYSPQISQRFSDVDLAIDCGDLPYYYVEYIVNALDIDLYFVRGNHSKVMEYYTDEGIAAPRGAINLHRRVVNHKGLLLAGVEGSGRYRNGPFQYTQGEMWEHVFHLMPALMANRLKYGRYLDVFITHAPPWGIHDQTDLPHQGIKAYCWFVKVFQPAYHFHGHIHVYRPDTETVTKYERTLVINTFGYKVTIVEPGIHSLGGAVLQAKG